MGSKPIPEPGLREDQLERLEHIEEVAALAQMPERHGHGVAIAFTVVLLVALLSVCAWCFIGVSTMQSQEQGALSIRQSVLDTAMQCYAIEGAYPPTLKYLEANYGLTVNTADYVITYEAFASNVMPTVVVRQR